MFKKFKPNLIGRDFAVGDIHGHFSVLEELLKRIDFDKSKDRLFSVGDLVDRGPESHRVGEFVGQPWFHAVRGNHEGMVLDPYIDDNNRLYNGQAWFLCLPAQEQHEVRLLLETLPIAIQVGGIGVVHADVPGYDWTEFVKSLEGGDETPVMMATWDRRRWGKSTPMVSGVSHVIVGHTPVDEVSTNANVINIDTGSGKGGDLTIISLSPLKVVAKSSTINGNVV